MPDIKKYLSKEGLENYNELLPHSAAQMQAYVNDWLDEHPEATTTVQDDSITTIKLQNGAVTEPKLADESVSLRTLAPDVLHMMNGAILTGNLSGEVLTASDAYAAQPVSLTVEGKSTQDGTPTPDAPVEIVSVENPELWFVGKNLFDPSHLLEASGWTVSNGVYTGALDKLYAKYNKTNPYPIVGLSDTPRSYTLSLDYMPTDVTTYSLATFAYADGTTDANIMQNAGHYSFASNSSKVLTGLYITYYSPQTVSLSNIQFELGSTATTYEPYEGHTVQLYDGTIRSLPDGTKDTLALSYLRPSTREGWAWYSAELVQRVSEIIINGARPISQLQNANYLRVNLSVQVKENSAAMADQLTWSNIATPNAMTIGANTTIYAWLSYSDFPTLDAYKLHLAQHPMNLLYELITPVVTQLDPIELPFTAAPDFTIWSNPSTGLQIEYVRNANIVIQNIEQAIADA